MLGIRCRPMRMTASFSMEVYRGTRASDSGVSASDIRIILQTRLSPVLAGFMIKPSITRHLEWM